MKHFVILLGCGAAGCFLYGGIMGGPSGAIVTVFAGAPAITVASALGAFYIEHLLSVKV